MKVGFDQKKTSLTRRKDSNGLKRLDLPQKPEVRKSLKSLPGKGQSKEEIEDIAFDPIGFKQYDKGSIACPKLNKTVGRCQLWRVPQPERLHNPLYVRDKFTYNNYHFFHPKVRLFWNGLKKLSFAFKLTGLLLAILHFTKPLKSVQTVSYIFTQSVTIITTY